jgi:hypothetical protein
MNRKISWTTNLLLVCGAIAMLGTPAAQAAPIPAIDFDGTADSRIDGPYVVGNLFTVGAQNLQVTALGVQDYGSDNAPSTDGFLASPRGVGIWDATGTSLLASTTVASTDPLTGTYRYATITPIELSAGLQYLIGASVGAGLEYFGDSFAAASYTGSPGLITLNASRFAFGGTLVAPTNSGGFDAGRWGPANFLAVPVPEPSSLALFLLGSALLRLVRTKRNT